MGGEPHLPGLAWDAVPAGPEIGDDVCLHRESALAVLNLLAAVAKELATD